MRFTYRTGERPLQGYTVKRGVGKGGFGEVYFAVSDSGKEVALKLLRGSTDVELRGVANCLNLKHPNLVHIYDLKEDGHGEKWLIMEYVLGESLAQVIDRHTNGLPVNLAVEWFQSLAKAVGYLHDHGVVHRDLKPANVFIEHGSLKVGDYGLCKAMSQTARQQTRSVGTVYYMAPEIGSGNYSKGIDIYACGIVLYEMLTGRLPFDGETDGEILMKHMTATPDLSGVPEEFRTVLARALDKNPEKRFASMSEFAKAVDGVHPSLPILPPQPVEPVMATTAVAVAAPVKTPVKVPIAVATGQAPTGQPTAQPVEPPVVRRAAPIVAQNLGTVRDRFTDLSSSLVQAPMVIAAAVVPWMVVTQTTEWADIGRMILLSWALTWAVLISSHTAKFNALDTWGRRLRLSIVGLAIGLFAFWLDGGVGPMIEPNEDAPGINTYLFGTIGLPARSVGVLAGYVGYFGCLLGAARWWRMAAKDRTERFSMFPPVVAVFWGWVLVFLWPWESASPMVGIVPMALATVAVQWVSPWVPPPPLPPKKLRWRSA